MTSRQLKTNMRYTAQLALKSEYGFKPSLESIILLEGCDDRTYIRFQIGIHEYVFSSYKLEDGSVWVGNGTIEKVR